MKKNDKAQFKITKKKKIGLSIILVLIISLITFNIFKSLEPVSKLSSGQQKSLITAETNAVKNNQKPDDIIGSLYPRMKKLSGDYKYQAVDLIYTSMQNSSLYYNNAAYMMSGEIDYSRSGSNPLSASKHNYWVLGFQKEMDNQKLFINGINTSTLIVMPDFKYLNDTYYKYSSSEMQALITAGSNAQDYNAFKNGKTDEYAAAKAFNSAALGYVKIKAINKNSKYIQDVNSLMRFYHDSALGLISTSDVKTSGEYTVFNKNAINNLNRIKNSKLLLSKEAKSLLNDMKDGKVKTTTISDLANKSLKTYGSSVYWQSSADISALTESGK